MKHDKHVQILSPTVVQPVKDMGVCVNYSVQVWVLHVAKKGEYV